MMKIGFSTFGDHSIGLGHVYRCAALRRRLLETWPEAKFTFDFEGNPESLRAAVPEAKLSAGPVDVLIVDKLSVAPDDARAHKARAHVLVSLDDAGAGRYEADFAFNALYRCAVPKPAGSRTECRDGFEYLIIDESFASLPYEPAAEIANIFLSQGGADTYGLLPLLTSAASAGLAGRKVALHALVGQAFRNGRELGAAAAASTLPVTIHQSVVDMPALLRSMDLAVSGAGVLACELAAVGVPTLLATGEKKELETARLLSERGAASFFGMLSISRAGALAGEIGRLADDAARRATLSKAARRLIDGKGLNRIAEILSAAVTKETR